MWSKCCTLYGKSPSNLQAYAPSKMMEKYFTKLMTYLNLFGKNGLSKLGE